MIETFKKVLNLFNDSTNPEEEVEKIAKLRQNVNDSIAIYTCTQIKYISTIIVHKKENKVREISFGDEVLSIKLSEIESLLGLYTITYSFRDNVTNFIFPFLAEKSIYEIVFSKDGKCNEQELVSLHFNNFAFKFRTIDS